MGADGNQTLCPGCRRPVVPGAKATILRIEQADVTGYSESGQREWTDGASAWFHLGCRTPPDRRYRTATAEENDYSVRVWNAEHP